MLKRTNTVIPPNAPTIFYRNNITTSNVTADNSDASYPPTNVVNPATFLEWRGDDVTTKLLLHGDGTNGATTVTDSSKYAHTQTLVGNTQISTAQSKFGGASITFDGTGDYITCDGSSDFAFGTGDFTIDFWVRLAAVGAQRALVDMRPASTNGLYPRLYVVSGNTLRYHTNSADRITGTTALSVNTWYHVALSRSNGSTKLFLNGTQEGSTYADTNSYLCGASRPTIGADGNTVANDNLNGFIDELRISKGIARWTANFTAPTAAYDNANKLTVDLSSVTTLTDYFAIARHNLFSAGIPVTLEGATSPGTWFTLFPAFTPDSDDVLIWQFEPRQLVGIRLSFGAATLAPKVAVAYTGLSLTLTRSVYVGHTPLAYGRSTLVTNGRSENGNYLGRIVVNEKLGTKVALSNLDARWYRDNMEPFVVAAKEAPFFFAWRPQTYPSEVGFCWLSDDPVPSNQRANGMMQVDLAIGGIQK